jgi:hypothetical protein
MGDNLCYTSGGHHPCMTEAAIVTTPTYALPIYNFSLVLLIIVGLIRVWTNVAEWRMQRRLRKQEEDQYGNR